jgi:polysaccharide pyruvyl transferase WcaK-like protein
LRILIDHSGYDLLNIGDVAMLQSCVLRLHMQWPAADIVVLAHDAGRLTSYCPGTTAIGPTIAGRPWAGFLTQRQRLASEQVWKMLGPYLSQRTGQLRIVRDRPKTAIQAITEADVVVASGGAYMTDTWWWHGAGVMSLLSLAQRMGKPTAMFGQAIGPMRGRFLQLQASAVLPRLAMLGLREDRMSLDLALSFGVSPTAVAVTGDDALELVGEEEVAGGHALGVNLRVSAYAKVNAALATAIGGLVLEEARSLHAPIVALPVSRYAADADLRVIRLLLRQRCDYADVALDIQSPDALASAAGSCRAVVTGSYHAALFGLAQGVPAVCLSKSSYYDAKFSGLRSLFPDACFVVSLEGSDLPSRLRAAIHGAWHLPPAARLAARDKAARLRAAGRQAYGQLREVVESQPLGVTQGLAV